MGRARQRLERGEQDGQALALLGAARRTSTRSASPGASGPLGRRPEVDSVGDDAVAAADTSAGRSMPRPRDRDAGGQLVELPAGAEEAGDVFGSGLVEYAWKVPTTGASA